MTLWLKENTLSVTQCSYPHLQLSNAKPPQGNCGELVVPICQHSKKPSYTFGQDPISGSATIHKLLFFINFRWIPGVNFQTMNPPLKGTDPHTLCSYMTPS